jgi:putative tricarboxylic transport membrane protein
MELIDHMLLGFGVALSPMNLLYCLLGVTIGTLIGVLPGIGPLAGVALLLPLTYVLPPAAAVIMLAGIFYGAQYGGSITSILVNMPGDASAVVTCIDGHAMARQGRAGPALAISAIGSFVAGCVATLAIMFLAPPLTTVALQFGPTEYFALMVVGLVTAISLAHGSQLKGFAMVVLGLLLGIVGTDVQTGTLRYTFGLQRLGDGLDLVAVAIGLFGFSHIIVNLEGQFRRHLFTATITGLMPTRADLRAAAYPIARGTLLGSLLGVLPGGGAVLSSFAAYSLEKKLAKDPSRFGRGAIEGVAGPESANNAASQTSLVPLMTLGIPPNPVIALIGGALIVQGVIPGPEIMTKQPDLFWGVIASMWIGNVMLLILNLPLVGIWVRLLRIPYQLLYPAIILFSCIGAYSVDNSTFAVWLCVVFGLPGYVLLKLDFEPGPLLLGFILGPMMEENLRRAMLLAHGDATVFLTQPISLVLLLIALALVAVMAVPKVKRKRNEVFSEETV